MAEKTMSLQELRELSSAGFDVEFDRKTMVIAQFGELIEQLGKIIAANDERVRADLARNQTQLEVLATLQALIKKNSGGGGNVTPSELAPLQLVLAEIQKANAERAKVAYTFDIHRGEGGYMRSVTATPLQQTTH